MTSLPARSRRQFVAGLGLASVASVTPASASPNEAGSPTSQLAPGLIHLNTASLGVTPPEVLERTLKAWREIETSPVYMSYGAKPNVLAAADAVRGLAARLLGCDADELLITRSTTEAMSTVAQGMRWTAGDRVLSTDQEHDGGSMCWQYVARRHGVAIDRVAIASDDHDTAGIVRRFAAAIRRSTRVISVSHVITSTGLRMPIAAIAALAHAKGILCVVDGAQAAGHIPVDVKSLGCHAYAASGHKWLMGPKGTGLLYVSRDAGDAIQPIQWEDGRRYGAESAGVGPMPLVIGLGAAIETLQEVGVTNAERRAIALRNRTYDGLRKIARLRVVSPPPGPLATAMIACKLPADVESGALKDRLHDRHGLLVKMVEKRRFNGLRFSPTVYNNEADIDALLKALRSELA